MKKGCSREAVSALFNGQKESQVVHEVRLNLNSKRSSGFDRDKEDRHARRRDRHESLLLSKFSTCARRVMQPRLVQESCCNMRLSIPRTDLLGLGGGNCAALFKICHTSGDSTPQKV